MNMTSYLRRIAAIALLLLAGAATLRSQPYPRNLLSRFTKNEVAGSLAPHGSWSPFPRTPAAWRQLLPDTLRQRLIKQAETYAAQPFEALPATLMLDYVRNGNRTRYEAVSFDKRERLFRLVVAESIEGQGRFRDPIVNGVWSLCEESSWGVPAHYFLQKAGSGLVDVSDPSVDLFASETAIALAFADYFCGALLDSVSPLLRKRVYDETNRRIFTPLERQEVPYGYLAPGTKDRPSNNWNPWVVSNWITSLLLLEKNEQRRAAELHHAMRLLDNYLNWMGEDGAVDEGPSYWFGAIGRLFNALNILDQATAGKVNIYKEPLIGRLCAYIYKMHIADDYFLSIADASPVIKMDGILLYRMGKATGDTLMRDFGAWAFHRADITGQPDFDKIKAVQNLMAFKECAAQTGAQPRTNDTWMESVQLMTARTGNGLFIASHGGHNAESHNHNDVGDVVLFAGNRPVIIDVGFGTYTAKTFSKDRYNLWYNSSAYHNLPVVNGCQQLAGRQYGARSVQYHSDAHSSVLDMDIAAAYPAATGLQQWRRVVTADKQNNQLVLQDSYTAARPLTTLTQTFMTICPVDIQPGEIIFDAGDRKVSMTYDADAWTVKQETIKAGSPDEKRLTDNWGHRTIYRLLLTARKPGAKGDFTYRFRETGAQPGAGPPFNDTTAYYDLQHNSRVFGRPKTYRLYLPRGYSRSTQRYPVIYFFHGWGGRYYKDDNALLEYRKIKQLADRYNTILVMWDGNIDEKEPRPYNVGNHEDVKFQVQIKDYFPELVSHIDDTYRTLADRRHRGLIGFSMGGFTALLMAGKYPDKVSAAVSLAGSPEFFVGYPGNHTLYPIRYTFRNLEDVAVRIHNGNTDILYHLNREVRQGALWEQLPIQYWEFNGGHMIDQKGETKVFEAALRFVADAFKKAAPAPGRWSHYDLYPDFSLWGYEVHSNKQEPGFIFLKQVSPAGLGVHTHRWLPDGPPLRHCDMQVTTAPLYRPGKTYQIARYEAAKDTVTVYEQQSDTAGRLSFRFDSNGGIAGVFDDTSTAEFVLLDHTVNEQGCYLKPGSRNRLSLRLFNRAGEQHLPADLQVSLQTADTGIDIRNSTVRVKTIAGRRILSLPVFLLHCYKQPPPHAEPHQVKFTVTIAAGKKIIKDDLVVPVLFDAPYFDSLRIDDGQMVRDKAFGRGNADGVINAGENVLLYHGSHRLRLYTDDPYVIPTEEILLDEMIPARWPDGFTLSSLIKVSPDCPDGHVLELLGSYETKTFNPIERKVRWGKVRLVVKGEGR